MTEKWILKDGVVVNTENNMTFDSFTELVIVLNGQSNEIKTLILQEEDRKLYQRELENKIKKLKSFKANVKEVLKHEYEGYQKRNDELFKENEQLKEQLLDCQTKKQNIKNILMHTDAVVEQKKLQKLIYRQVIAVIDDKINEVNDEKYKAINQKDVSAMLCFESMIELLKDLKEELKGDV